MANMTQLQPGATRAARKAAWRARQAAEQARESEQLWAAVPDKVRANRRMIADLALAHPAVTGLEVGSVARAYATAVIQHYAGSPVRSKEFSDSRAWAFTAALNDLTTHELQKEAAVGLGRKRAEKALRDAFGLFHESSLRVIKLQLVTAS